MQARAQVGPKVVVSQYPASGCTAIRRRDMTPHCAWMFRSTPSDSPPAHPGLHRRHRRPRPSRKASPALVGTGDLDKGAGWMINVAVADWSSTRLWLACRQLNAM